ncbi:MAG: efflux RND transporter periplasmic adaptor subunit [Paludibacter sp.]|nr:efflux RND transporter periplasmic adaptor subunit [Paludibacter sp.]
MRKLKFLGIFIIAIAAVTLVSCNKKEKAETAATESTASLPKVKLALAEIKDINQNGSFTATVEPDVKNNIAPSAPGRIRHIFVEVGDHISKGQKIAQMDVANLSNLETQVENYKKNYKRVSELFSVGGASQQELDNAKLQLDMADTNLKNMSENTYLLSPINGVITAKNYDEGDLYTGQMAIATVMQINPVKLKINVSESFYSQIKTGMPVSVKLDVFKDEEFSGKVSLIYPTIDERTRTFTVEIKLPNNNGKIKPGMFARVGIDFGSLKRVVVPDVAVVKQVGSGARFVYIYNNGVVVMKQIGIGQRFDDLFEITSGLDGNEQIVVSGISKLVDGCKVNVVK